MARWLIAIGAALLTALGAWLTLLNPETVSVRWAPERIVTLPMAEALIAAFAIGAAVVTLLASARGIGRAWERSRRRRRAARLARDAAATAHARSLVWAGAYDQARAELGVAAVDAPLDPERVELAAESYLAEGDLAAARALLDRAISRVGPQPRLLDLLAQAAERAGDLPGAIGTLEGLRPTLANTPRLARRLRDLYIAAERFDDALAVQSDLLLGLRRGPALVAEERALVGLRYALACRDTEPRRAARRLSAIARQAPDFVPAFVAAGDRWLAAGRPFFARRIWERGVRRHAVQPLVDRLLALHESSGHPERSTRLYQRLRQTHPDAPLLDLRRAQQLLAAGRLDDAGEALAALPAAVAAMPVGQILAAELERRRADGGTVDQHLAAARDTLVRALPHQCTACGATAEGWADRCPQCAAWGYMELRMPPATT